MDFPGYLADLKIAKKWVQFPLDSDHLKIIVFILLHKG